MSDYISVYTDHAVDKQISLLIDHTFSNRSSAVDIYDRNF